MKKHENKFSKRAFAILLALALCMGMLPFTAVALCAPGDHEWDGIYENAGFDCITDILAYQHCKICGVADTSHPQTVPAVGHHTYEYTNNPAGLFHTATCVVCGYFEPLRHHKVKHEATCTTPATCICGKEMAPQLEHDFRGTWVQVGTDGHAQLCVNGCNQPGPEESHTPDEWMTTQEPTCTAEGKKVKKCTGCGVVLMTESIAKAEHAWDEGKVSTSPECGGAIVKTFTCIVCKATKTETIGTDAGHAWGAGEVTKSPTCKEPGVMTYTCTKCSATKTAIIALNPNAHSSLTEEKTEATCTAKGSIVKSCADCGYSETTELDMLQHDFTVEKTVAPTCTEKGYTVKCCSVCGMEEATSEHGYVDANGHAWGAWETTRPADYGVKGERKHTCTVCNAEETEEIPALIGPELPPVIDITPPVEPVDPVDPIDPVDPVDPDDGDGDVDIDDPDVPLGPGPGDTEEPDGGDEDIDDPDVPLGPGPGDTEEPDGGDVDIDDPDVPLGPGPGGDEDGDDTSGQQPGGSDNKPQNPGNSGNGGEDGDDEIEDEPVPLAATPKTGDNQGMLWVLFLVSGAALTGLVFAEKKRGEQ